MKKIEKLRRLHELTEMQFLAIQTEMSELSNKEQQLRKNLIALSRGVAKRAGETTSSDDPALIAGADIRWHRWIDQRKAVINTELAALLARQEICRAKLGDAFGKSQVVENLQNQAATQQQNDRDRKSNYES